jgi:GxxExxY protein
MQRRQYTEEDDPLTYKIIGCAMHVHRELGAGLVESVYEECLEQALIQAGLTVQRQSKLAVPYEGITLDKEYRPDLIVNGEVVIEVKSVSRLLPVHESQTLTYMKLSGCERGLLINFNVALLKDGIRRLIMTKAPQGASVSLP